MEDPEARQGPEEDVVDLVAEEEEEQQQQGGGGWAAAAPRARWAAAAAAAGPAGGAAAAAGQQAAEEEELAADIMREAASGVLLPFQRAMVEELLEEDGLCVLSPGLGLHHVVAVLLRLQDARLRQPGQRGCVLVLGASPWQRDALRRELLRIDPVIRAKAQAVAAGRAASAAGARAAGALPPPLPCPSPPASCRLPVLPTSLLPRLLPAAHLPPRCPMLLAPSQPRLRCQAR